MAANGSYSSCLKTVGITCHLVLFLNIFPVFLVLLSRYSIFFHAGIWKDWKNNAADTSAPPSPNHILIGLLEVKVKSQAK